MRALSSYEHVYSQLVHTCRIFRLHAPVCGCPRKLPSAQAGPMALLSHLVNSAIYCSLNGELDLLSARCACDAPWHGETCEHLTFEPVDSKLHPGAAAFGWAPNISSWGGSIIFSDIDHMWHLFGAQMKSGGLIGWQRQSECIHAQAGDPAGPFTFHDVAVKSECHGPAVLTDPQTTELLMFHQGDHGWLHHAKTPAGPWRPALGPRSCGMPTAAFHPNGTLYVICGNGERIVAAEGNWSSGSWRDVHGSNWSRPHLWEDPSLWFDRHGHWHVIFHVYHLDPYAAHNEAYSGHAYSEDGVLWHFSDSEPFNGTVSFAGGARQTFSTRERPQLVFSHGGRRGDASKLSSSSRHTPIGLTNGVSAQPLGPWCDHCKQGACSQCKITPGRDWTYTTYVPLVQS